MESVNVRLLAKREADLMWQPNPRLDRQIGRRFVCQEKLKVKVKSIFFSASRTSYYRPSSANLTRVEARDGRIF